MPGPMRMAIARRAAVLLLGLAAAACSAGGPLGPDTPLAEPAIDRGWITSPSGARLALYSWPAQGRTRAVILGLHVFGDSGEFAFGGPAVGDWTRRGIAVYAIDQRGFGANPSSRQWPGAGRLR